MSGPTNTEWSKYLNGGSSKYNFSYREANEIDLNPMPEIPNAKLDFKLNPKLNVNTNNKSNVSKLAKNMKGGKQKTRRHKKYRHSRRK